MHQFGPLSVGPVCSDVTLGQRTPVQGSHWYTQSVVATGGVYKGQGLSHGELSDSPLQGIPRLWEKIARPRPNHASNVWPRPNALYIRTRAFTGLPAPVGVGKIPAVPGIVARVRPRTSKGITDLLLLSVSYGFRTVYPSKKSFKHERRTWSVWSEARSSDTRGPPATECRAEPPQSLGIREILQQHHHEGIPTRTRNNEESRYTTQTIINISRSNRLVSRGESRSLSELTRQITPPTKNGHAPPSNKSRKSSQSVNRTRVLAW